MGALSTPDLTLFFASLVAVMVLGLWAGRKEDTSQDFYLAGKNARWWGVAGSIFGSNVSANHIVGMMGVGFSVGFAQSHFEITAVAGLLLLAYGFLPVYRKLNVYTLSEYLSRRYDDRCRVLYAVIMIFTLVVIQIVPGFYIGSRSLNILLAEDTATTATAPGPAAEAEAASEAAGEEDLAAGPAPAAARHAQIGFRHYVIGILVMVFVTGTYTILGGLKAVIITDVIQSVLMLAGGLIVAVLTFAQPEIGGWAGMRALDAAPGARDMMHLYLPSNHPRLPWSGVLTGLLIMHFHYWSTNQFIVQRALAARSAREARVGIVVAGFLKLLIPLFSIGTGVAAYYLFAARLPGTALDQDTAFPMLMRHVVAPLGFGLVGVVAAGLIGAILSSIDSMLNSAATVITFDFYRRYFRPGASEKELVRVGQACIVAFLAGAALLTIFTMDPNSQDSFFLQIADEQAKLTIGIVVAFGLGMFWRRSTAAAGLASIVAGIVFSYALPPLYRWCLAPREPIAALFGEELNFMHRAALVTVLTVLVHVVVTLKTQPDAEKSRFTWTDLGGHRPHVLRRVLIALGASIALYALLALVLLAGWTTPLVAGLVAAVWTWALFVVAAVAARRGEGRPVSLHAAVTDDRFWAGLLAATAVWMMFHFA